MTSRRVPRKPPVRGRHRDVHRHHRQHESGAGRGEGSALSFHKRLSNVIEKGKEISQLRLRVIAFRDFGDFADDAIEQTDFLAAPAGGGIRDVRARAAGRRRRRLPRIGPRSARARDQLAWETGLDRRRHVIVMFTDAPAHPLGTAGARSQTYPAGIPRCMDELFEQWGSARSQAAVMDQSAKRLVLFAPEEEPWKEIGEEWNLTLHFPSKAGEGLEEFEMDEIIDTIANSL